MSDEEFTHLQEKSTQLKGLTFEYDTSRLFLFHLPMEKKVKKRSCHIYRCAGLLS